MSVINETHQSPEVLPMPNASNTYSTLYILYITFFTCFSSMSFHITPLHLSFDLPIFRCPTTSIFHVIISTHSSLSLYTWFNHPSLALLFSHCLPHTWPCSYFFIPDRLIISVIHLNTVIFVVSSKVKGQRLTQVNQYNYLGTTVP